MKKIDNDEKIFSYNDVVSILEKLQYRSYENRQAYIKNNGYNDKNAIKEFLIESNSLNAALFAFNDAFKKIKEERI